MALGSSLAQHILHSGGASLLFHICSASLLIIGTQGQICLEEDEAWTRSQSESWAHELACEIAVRNHLKCWHLCFTSSGAVTISYCPVLFYFIGQNIKSQQEVFILLWFVVDAQDVHESLESSFLMGESF